MVGGNVLHASTTPARSVRSPGPYEIRRYDARLRSQVLDLQGHLWHSDASVNDAYLEWKYYRNPYMDDPVIHVALSKGQVVGMRGVYGAKWEVGNPAQQFIIPCAGDLVVAPDHRDVGLLLKILEAAAIDLATSYPVAYVKGRAQRLPSMYVFSLSAGPASQLASLLTGWRNVGYLEPATRQSSSLRGERWLARQAGAWLPERLVPVFSLAADAARDLLSAAEQRAATSLDPELGPAGGRDRLARIASFSWTGMRPAFAVGVTSPSRRSLGPRRWPRSFNDSAATGVFGTCVMQNTSTGGFRILCPGIGSCSGRTAGSRATSFCRPRSVE